MTEPHYTNQQITVWHGDCLEVLRDMPDCSVDSVVTDPPYGLEFMGKEWDAFRPQRDPRTAGRSGVGPVTTGAALKADGGMTGARVSYGGKRPTTWRCDACNKRDQFRNHSTKVPDCQGLWHLEVIDSDAPAPLVYFQQWCQMWATECLRVLKPGGHMLAFGGTRTWHRLACAVDDAGFEIRDSIAWLYGQGFPKSLDVSKAIERAETAADPLALLPDEERFCAWMRNESGLSEQQARDLFASARFLTGTVEVVNTATVDHPRMGRRAMVPTAAAWDAARPYMASPPKWVEELVKSPPKPPMQTPSEWKAGRGQGTVGGSTPDAARWQGWGTALKPSHEPIVVARKPLGGVVRTVCGRCQGEDEEYRRGCPNCGGDGYVTSPVGGTVAANALAHGTGALNIDACRIASDEPIANHHGTNGAAGVTYGNRREYVPGSASPANTQTAGRWPPNVAMDEHTAKLLDQQSGEIAPSFRPGDRSLKDGHNRIYGKRANRQDGWNQTEAGYGDSGGASRFMYVAKADSAERVRIRRDDAGPDFMGSRDKRCANCGKQRVNVGTSSCACADPDFQPDPKRHGHIAHPTVKPLDLMRWLVRLVTPPGGLVLDPFAGSGTTAEAALLEGFRCTTIEREAEYLPLIVQRINRRLDPVQAIRDAGEPLGLFNLEDQ